MFINKAKQKKKEFLFSNRIIRTFFFNLEMKFYVEKVLKHKIANEKRIYMKENVLHLT